MRSILRAIVKEFAESRQWELEGWRNEKAQNCICTETVLRKDATKPVLH